MEEGIAKDECGSRSAVKWWRTSCRGRGGVLDSVGKGKSNSWAAEPLQV